ncbi:ABC transporter permease [Fibrella aquatilis]|uniref:ABC transporter permease n=1 Tax=Fibrella aquatilis TaxID=2817059 RepID=A0A939G6R9_9BACT|nr:ABC transporter permease [Fibrella aquatilis]MBO0932896.1 ABC transporter permease [Fibrella aquatilis]
MTLANISWSNLKDKPLSSFLSGLLMTLGIAIISLLLLLNKQLQDQFSRNIRGVDMVIGAKGSPLQLILSSIYQIDSPVGNIPLAEAQRLTRNPLIKSAIPMAMGDSYRSFRIVGTNQKYLDQFGATVAQGKPFSADLEVVIGPRVVEVTGLKVGDSFASQHGFDANGEEHGNKKYRVVGLLAPSNSVCDQLILTNVSSIWAIHEGHDDHHDEATAGPPTLMPMAGAMAGKTPKAEHHDDEEGGPGEGPEAGPDAGPQITAMLVKFRNPMGMMLKRGIDNSPKLQAALPAIEVNRLFDLLGVGIETLRGLALAIILVAGISVFVSLYNSLKERRYEMALMLSMGATRAQLFGMLLLEGLVLALIGFVAGLALSRLGLWLLSQFVEGNYHYSFSSLAVLPDEWYLLIVAVVIGLLAAALPALGVYHMNISRVLAEE